MGKALFDKIWDSHVITDLGNGFILMHIDRLLLHDMSGGKSMKEAIEKGYAPAQPRLIYATPDHTMSTKPGRTEKTHPPGEPLILSMRETTGKYGIKLFDLGQDGNGIVHVMGPEQGLTLPGTTLVCGDSHTSTHGGMGALAYGIGASELVHVIATQTMVQRKPKRFRASFEGKLQPGVTSKDMILHLIGDVGTAAGTGFAVEYAGSAIRALPLEARLTLCNLTIEMGARTGMVAPDDTTYEYLHGRDYAPKDAMWDRAVAYWRTLPSDPDTEFDREHTIDMAKVAPQITWGTSPEHVIAVDRAIPDPAMAGDKRAAWEAALQYQGLEPGKPIEGTKVDWVFIGSCTNSRITDIRAAAEIVKGRHKADHVTAWVVPGSERIKKQAESEGLDKVFLDAGFEWREPGCSMCLASNGERVPPGMRSVSTSNRNFVGRQGPGARTHLASPAMAAAAAIKGAIADVEEDVTMDKFTKVTGVAAPLMRQNVDTDLIIRIERLVDNVGREGLGPYAFEQIRFKPDGSENPDCIFNQEPYRDSPIILSRENFGCGSSREGAVWALKGMGIKAVIAPYFGDIFNNNCFQNGILPVPLPIEDVEQLADEMKASPGNARVTVDLENCVVISPTGRTIPFKVEAHRQHAMLNGLDDIAQTKSHQDKIEAWQTADKSARPWVWL